MEETRQYNEKLVSKKHMMTVDTFLQLIEDGTIMDDDGFGYWVKDGSVNKECGVFSSLPLDATHVVWYNK